MTNPPTDKECEVILQWMHTYYAGPLEPWEREFIRDTYCREEFDEGERMTIDKLAMDHLEPLPESLAKLLREAK